MDKKDAKKPAAQPLLANYKQLMGTFVRMIRFAEKRNRATGPSAFINSIERNARFFAIFAVFLVGSYGSHVSFYQVLFFCVTVSLVYLYITYAPFLSLEEDIKWIRRESRILLAISEDAAKLRDLTDQIDTRAHEIFDSELYSSGIITIAALYKIEAAWVTNTMFVALKAQKLVARFEKQRGDGSQSQSKGSARILENLKRIGVATILENMKQIERLILHTRRVKEEIDDSIVMKKVRRINICESLERSRSNIRSLRDRPIIEQDQEKWEGFKARVASAADLALSLAQKIKGLISQNPDLMRESTGEQISMIRLQLLLLHPFLKDILVLRLESKVEEAWVEEMEEIINEANAAINNFSLRPAHGIVINSWYWKTGRKLKRDISGINVGFAQLLERKERYGFKFIRRDSSKFVYHESHHHNNTSDDRIIAFVIARMRRYLIEHSDVMGEATSEVALLCNQIENMHKLVGGDAGMIEFSRYNSRMAWLEQMRKIALRAERSVATFIQYNSAIVSKKHPLNKGAGKYFAPEVDRIKRTINLLMRSTKVYGIELRAESSSVVGLEEDVDAVVSELISSREPHSIHSILGIEGIGKTTLAKEIFYHETVVRHFLRRSWFPYPYHEFSKVICTNDRAEGDGWLIVVDNISTEERLDVFVNDIGPHTRILFTTRDNNLASKADSPPHKLRLRSKEESWKLFSQMVHFPPNEERLAKQILGTCGGFPLAILRLGYLMSGKHVRTTAELELMRQYMLENDTLVLGTDNTLTDSLKALNVDDPLLKCVSYMKLFPRELEIPARRLIALWIAEGFVKVTPKPSETYEDVADLSVTPETSETYEDVADGYLSVTPETSETYEDVADGYLSVTPETSETYEDVADGYLSELIARGMIQVVERKFNGKVNTCRLPYAIEQFELEDMNSRRLTLRKNWSPCSCDENTVSIFSFDTREGDKPGEEIGRLLGKTGGSFYRELLVLDLEGVFKPALPKKFGKYLSKLRYLGLRWTYLDSIPESVEELLNLQVLDVKHTNIRNLPSSIMKLQELRHLYLNQSYRTKSMPQQGQRSSLMNIRTLWGVFVDKDISLNLQTLWGAFVDKDFPLKDGLQKVTTLRKLGLSFQLNEAKEIALADWIAKLKQLQSLKLRSVDKKGKPSYLPDMHLSRLGNLRSIHLFGKMRNSSQCRGMPRNLTQLTLSFSGISNDPMPMLEDYPHLKFLCLNFNSFEGKKMTCSGSGFKKLRVLKLWKLDQLEDWNVEKEAMQNLRELEVRSCKRLNVPSGWRYLKTLTELKLTNMPKEFATTIEKTKGQLWDDFNHTPAIIAINWQECAE